MKSYELYPYSVVAFLINNKTYTKWTEMGKIALGIRKTKKK